MKNNITGKTPGRARVRRGWHVGVLRVLAGLLALCALPALPARALSDEEREAEALAAGQTAVETVLTEDMTDLEALTALHDWLALRCDYAATLRSETAYGALVEGAAVCRGYAAGYALLAELAGLAGADTYSDSLDHAWILATLDGGRYFSDCTWDDGKNQKLGLIRHTYFLFDENNAVDVGHSGWDSPEAVPGGALENVPWREAVTRVIFRGDDAWYIDRAFRLIRCDRQTWQTEVVFQSDARWPAEESGAAELYTGLILVRGRLYFNTPNSLWYYDIAADQARPALGLKSDDGRSVYGIGVLHGTLQYSLAGSADDIVYDLLDTGISAAGAWGY